MLKRLSIVMLASLALACGDRLSIRVDTEGTVFDRAPQVGATVPLAGVPYTVTNTGDQAAFLPACGERPMVVIERLNGGTWEQWSGNACLAIMPMTPIDLRSGNRVASGVGISDAGRFRLRLSYADNGAMAREQFAYSEPFDVR